MSTYSERLFCPCEKNSGFLPLQPYIVRRMAPRFPWKPGRNVGHVNQ